MNRREGFRKIGRHIGPCPLLAGCISFGEQLFESRDYCGPRHTELNAEFARRWQLRSGTQRSAEDCGSQLQVDLAEHRRVRGAVHLAWIKLGPALPALHKTLAQIIRCRSRSGMPD